MMMLDTNTAGMTVQSILQKYASTGTVTATESIFLTANAIAEAEGILAGPMEKAEKALDDFMLVLNAIADGDTQGMPRYTLAYVTGKAMNAADELEYAFEEAGKVAAKYRDFDAWTPVRDGLDNCEERLDAMRTIVDGFASKAWRHPMENSAEDMADVRRIDNWLDGVDMHNEQDRRADIDAEVEKELKDRDAWDER